MVASLSISSGLYRLYANETHYPASNVAKGIYTMLYNLQACNDQCSSLTCHSIAEFTRSSKNTVHLLVGQRWLDNGGLPDSSYLRMRMSQSTLPVAVFKLLSPQWLQWILHHSP
jgi:hypothetical protein